MVTQEQGGSFKSIMVTQERGGSFRSITVTQEQGGSFKFIMITQEHGGSSKFIMVTQKRGGLLESNMETSNEVDHSNPTCFKRLKEMTFHVLCIIKNLQRALVFQIETPWSVSNPPGGNSDRANGCVAWYLYHRWLTQK